MDEKKDKCDQLESFYDKGDPWGYEDNPDDLARRAVLLKEFAHYSPSRVLDIGCGDGFITRSLSGDEVVGVDIAQAAIDWAEKKVKKPTHRFVRGAIIDLPKLELGRFDAIVITGVLYPHYIGASQLRIVQIIDQLLHPDGCLFSVHIFDWYQFRFPYFRVKDVKYAYREYTHLLEVYRK